MANKMLIDAAHPEETRVVVLRNNRVEEFDYESANKKQLRGNIYLAKVTRVEPSLQAAFVDYGGNRHGFLAFSEIHPDYYQIPIADRQALLEEEAEEESRARAQEDLDAESSQKNKRKSRRKQTARSREENTANVSEFDEGPNVELDVVDDEFPLAVVDGGAALDSSEAEAGNPISDEAHLDIAMESVSPGPSLMQALKDPAPLDDETETEDSEQDASDDDISSGKHNAIEEDGEDEINVESVGSEDALEELPQRTRRRRRSYKIQEVIKRRQIILVQVVKEERGNKGAALTTYLSLAGRYTVLMPNTARGGGISRKITNPTDRKRLRKIAGEIEVPQGTGLIIRTAGATRTKSEIKRDFEYLLRLWENVRDLTLKSTAPSLVYEEGNLIKRSIRDLYSKEIEEVLVAGDEAYREAKDFMRMLTPSHAKNVQPYKEPNPLFIKYQIERQLNAMFSPFVTLRSGGYIVINQTEALVAIDVNSGKATREHSIEDTALKTNLEAAEEISRQLRLRDLAGLIVIDFIDMEEHRNNRSVERRLKDCLRNDRARIQIGRISHFGLLEMSRQRLRTGVLEGSTSQCDHCQGTGMIRSTESVSLSVLRGLEDTLHTGDPVDLNATTSVDVAIYVLNQKRLYIKDIEKRFGVTITVSADQQLHGANFTVERLAKATPQIDDEDDSVIHMDWTFQEPETKPEEDDDDATMQKKPRKRRRKRRPRGEQSAEHQGNGAGVSEAGAESGEDGSAANEVETQSESDSKSKERDSDEYDRKPRRRGRRGGRRVRSTPQHASEEQSAGLNGHRGRPDNQDNAVADEVGVIETADAADSETETSERPKRGRRMRSRRRPPSRRSSSEAQAKESTTGEPDSVPEVDNDSAPASSSGDVATDIAVEPSSGASSRRGWWQRRL